MNNFIARQILHAITLARKQPLFDSLRFLEKSQWWTYEKLQEYQNTKLSMLLQHCSRNVPYYRKWFRERGCNPLDINVTNMSSLPIINKEFLRKNLQLMCAEKNKGSFEEAKTSGSTGIALHFPKSLSSSAFQLAAMYRGHRWHDVDLGAREARLWGIPVNKLSRFKTSITDVLLNRFRECEYNLNPDVLSDFYEKLKRLNPEYLMGYTSMVSQFANFLYDNKMDGTELNLKMVKCTSETIHESDRKIIETVFGCRLVSEYGAAETGLVAFQCEAGSHHLMADCCIVEFVEPSEDLGDASLKEIVITNLDNFALPIVRYRIGDLGAQGLDRCICGRGLPLIRNIIGRTSDVIKMSDGRRWHSIVLYYVMKGLEEKQGGVVQFKVFQKEVDHLELYLVPDKKFNTGAKKYIIDRFKQIFGEKMRVDFQVVDSIPREPSGKMRDFVSSLQANGEKG